MTCKRDGCDKTGEWDWHDGKWQDGAFCEDHIREKLVPESRLEPNREPYTTEEMAQEMENRPLVRTSGAVPAAETYPVIRTREALNHYVGNGGFENF